MRVDFFNQIEIQSNKLTWHWPRLNLYLDPDDSLVLDYKQEQEIY
jgi:hypothetical protein